MQDSRIRYLILLGLLTVSSVLLRASGSPRSAEAASWPSADSVFRVDPWTASGDWVEARYGLLQFVSRHYHHPGGLTARLLIRTSPEAKQVYPLDPWVLYDTGEDVPLWGHEYIFEPAPADLGSPAAMVRGNGRQWLLLYRYGAGGKQAGNGLVAWAHVLVDGLLGRRNDYYLASLLIPLEPGDSKNVAEAGKLANTLFDRLAAWYDRDPRAAG